ncbi:MAG: hypothetical protein IPN97_04990 [Saprospiraceae bacterium]|nr:hypothetical protein [Saprospiraceae bacterium]
MISTKEEKNIISGLVTKAYLAVEDYNKATINFQMATQTGPEDTQSWFQ